VQPVDGKWNAAVKDQLESACAGRFAGGDITLKQGQAIFLAPDWTAEWENLVVF